MSSSPFSVEAWQQWQDSERRARLQPGATGRVEQGPEGGHFNSPGAGPGEGQHPWFVRCAYLPRPEDPRRSSWRAFVRPGLVNGRDVTVTSPISELKKIDGKAYGLNPLSNAP